MVLVVKKFFVDFLSPDLMPLKFYSVKQIIDKNIEHMNCCTTDYSDGFLISCVLNSKADPDDYGSVFAGQNREGTQIVIIRVHLDMKNPARPAV